MLLLNKDLWESDRILKVKCSENWEQDDTTILVDCALQEVKTLIEESAQKCKRCVLLLDCNKGEVPPMFQLGKMMSFLISIKSSIVAGVDFSMIYSKQDNYKHWLDIILQMYTPARPLHIVKNKESIKKLLSQREEKNKIGMV